MKSAKPSDVAAFDHLISQGTRDEVFDAYIAGLDPINKAFIEGLNKNKRKVSYRIICLRVLDDERPDGRVAFAAYLRKLASEQESLGPVFSQVLNDNLWNLYETDI